MRRHHCKPAQAYFATRVVRAQPLRLLKPEPLAESHAMHATLPLLEQSDFPAIRRRAPDTLQVNLG
ncbi:MAG: hypothetical protein FJY44_11265, partial [Betaproteobacteria bacterium]|nr:hypothetical protein [Betaproteobacteria bacterium]